MPTLGEFVGYARRRYGFSRRQITINRPGGRQARIRYLWRDQQRFAALPDVRDSDRLTRANVESLCRQLGIPAEDFGVEESE